MDGKKSKMLVPGLVRQIWVTYPDKNSHSGKLWGRKQVLICIPAQALGKVSMPHEYLVLVLYKCGAFKRTTLATPSRPG